MGCLVGGGRRSIRVALAVAEYVRARGAGGVVSTGEKGDGGTASREDRTGTAVVLIFAGIFAEIVKKTGFKDRFASCERARDLMSKIQSKTRRDDAVKAHGLKRQ
jgi:hypothetical protein